MHMLGVSLAAHRGIENNSLIMKYKINCIVSYTLLRLQLAVCISTGFKIVQF